MKTIMKICVVIGGALAVIGILVACRMWYEKERKKMTPKDAAMMDRAAGQFLNAFPMHPVPDKASSATNTVRATDQSSK